MDNFLKRLLSGILCNLLIVLSFSSGVMATPKDKDAAEDTILLEEKYKKDVDFVKAQMEKAKSEVSLDDVVITSELNKLGEEYNTFIEEKIKKDKKDPNDFAVREEYAKKYIIEFSNNVIQKGSFIFDSISGGTSAIVPDPNLTKNFVRSQWIIGAGILNAAGYPIAAQCLYNSLQDNPPTLTSEVGGNASNQVKNTKACEKLLSDFKSKLEKQTGKYYSESGSMTLTEDNATKDLFLALHKVGTLTAAEKINGTWNIYLWVYDTYDFEWSNYSDITNEFVLLVNNYATISQAIGAIVPYPINIYIQDSK